MTPLDLSKYTRKFRQGPWGKLPAIAPRALPGPGGWIAHTAWNGDFGNAKFLDVPPLSLSPEGYLEITMSEVNGKWQSGLLSAADATGADNGSAMQYGYWQALMKMPPGPGVWPAFWLVSCDVEPSSLPSHMEFDVVEYYGYTGGAFYSATMHRWFKSGAGTSTEAWAHITPPHSGYRPPVNVCDAFHSYGIRIAPDLTTYYFDEKPVWEIATPVEHDRPVYPIVNLACGAGWPITDMPNPSVLQVHFVEAWAPKS